jgi:hypothetical protein
MSAFDPATALAQWIELWNRRDREFQALPDFQRRCERGDYDFFSSADLDLDHLREVAQQHGFRLDWTWDSTKQQSVYEIEQMTPEGYEAYLMESREEENDDDDE